MSMCCARGYELCDALQWNASTQEGFRQHISQMPSAARRYLTTGRPLLQENKRSPVVLPNAQALKDWTIWELMHNPLPA